MGGGGLLGLHTFAACLQNTDECMESALLYPHFNTTCNDRCIYYHTCKNHFQVVRLADPIQLYAELTTHVPQHDLHRVGGSAFYKFCKIAIKQDNVYELVMGKYVHYL